MKVIDLLNKIANGADVPKCIRYSNVYTCILVYDEIKKDYSIEKNYYMFQDRFRHREECEEEFLNDEVEVIEDTPSDIEEIQPCYYDDEEFSEQQQIAVAFNKINQLIQAVKELKGKSE